MSLVGFLWTETFSVQRLQPLFVSFLIGEKYRINTEIEIFFYTLPVYQYLHFLDSKY